MVATQNPIEYEGTYRLPEAQLDRFLLKLEIEYPPADEEDRILRLYQGRAGLGHPLDILGDGRAAVGDRPESGELLTGPGITAAQIQQARQAVAGVTARPEVCSYIGKIVRLTRETDRVLMGASSSAACLVMPPGSDVTLG